MPLDFLLVSFVIILWWIGIWGFVETLVHQYSKGCPIRALTVYTGIMIVVICSVIVHPSLLEKIM
jgi:hypothetical protein